ncbi:MAG TPA: hypothetical protein VHC23_06945 [Jatrophihabitans sp.]|nr:hypothetical protein [Jatrophihabitans sp.]
MRRLPMTVLFTLLAAGAALVAAPAAWAGPVLAGDKDHASGDTGWLIALAVVVLLGLAFLGLRLRNGMSKRRTAGPFRRP